MGLVLLVPEHSLAPSTMYGHSKEIAAYLQAGIPTIGTQSLFLYLAFARLHFPLPW
jgi:hypothetical protein